MTAMREAGALTAARSSQDDFEFMNRKEAAEYLRRRWRQQVSHLTLATYVTRGGGPKYFRTPSHTLYERKDLDAWALGRLVPCGT